MILICTYRYRYTCGHTYIYAYLYVCMCFNTRICDASHMCFFMNPIFTIFSPNIQPACVTLRYRFPETTTARRSLYLLALTSCVRNICSVRKNIQKVCLHTYVCKYVHISGYLYVRKNMYVCICVSSCIYIHMYKYIYVYSASYEYSPWTMVQLHRLLKSQIQFNVKLHI